MDHVRFLKQEGGAGAASKGGLFPKSPVFSICVLARWDLRQRHCGPGEDGCHGFTGAAGFCRPCLVC